MPGGEVADVEHYVAEGRCLHGLPLGKEPIGDSPLVEDLDRACMEPSGTGADELRRYPSLDDCHIDPRQCQFPGQHQAGRTASHDDHVVHPRPAFLSTSENYEPCQGPCRKPPVALYVEHGKEFGL